MPLDRIQDKGDPRPETEKQFEKYGEQLFSVPISFDVDTTNNPKPSPAAITSRPKSRESLSDTNKKHNLHMTERKNNARPGIWRKIQRNKKTLEMAGQTTLKASGKISET